jgi:hypothetical protein
MYTKPELIVMASAVRAIQNHTAKGCNCEDGTPPHQETATAPAYEADE